MTFYVFWVVAHVFSNIVNRLAAAELAECYSGAVQLLKSSCGKFEIGATNLEGASRSWP